ncbi:L-threonine 3-dehydrogenase [Mycolicibacterium nivoides]|uniref:L-threonine 3-dehydrogenase n=1 Tax=Mycolicibacterium nivoides TaxID=2487344 RepID=A0ABW9LK33_9MYCO
MRALIKPGPGEGLVLTDVPKPEPAENEVLIKVLRTGICGTDLHIEAWDGWAESTIRPPLVLGHEFVGEVVDAGRAVRRVRVGSVVSGEGHLVCGQCRNCLAGRRHACASTVGLGVQRDGAFAEYVTLPEENVWIHRHQVDLDVAAIFDPLGNAVHTTLAFPVLGEDVLITGAGPIGLMAAAVAKHAGARHVVLTDVNEYRLALGAKVGVDATVDVSRSSVAGIQAELDMVEGFDVGLEMSGRASALESMIANIRHGGRIALLGLPSDPFPADFSAIVLKMLTLRGIYGREMFDTWYSMSVLLQSGLDISPIITHRFAYTEYEAAFATAHGGDCGKIILDWG